MAIRFNMFKTPNHRKYGYIPRYYNPDKEEMENKLKRARLLADDSIEGTKARISNQMKRGRKTKEFKAERKKAMFRSNMLLLFILGVLLIGGFIAMEVYLPELLETLE